ncbi:FecR domain-containing protein [Fulvivirgaceae bacterium PWU5]|uniref:FecR domain-containing protein n=1 Tax=Dawidia cretensis TaxID=2782350 RepID=A0AAP2DWM2_9BACT|nr:FecR family protein [Dawidia cretensis]MBT1708636.1 FecR domain-containing protein [Dawidia cretensis]
MNKSEFEQLIEKYQRGLLSGKEKELMDAWFDAMGRDEVKPLRTEAEREGLKRRVMAGVRRSRTSTPVRVWRIAASILLVAAASFAVWQYTTRPGDQPIPRELTASSEEGFVQKVLLDDGSLVWLKNNSSLTYPEKFTGKERRVALRGEALFEVAKDASHPFIIQCGELTTTVLGTSFNIKSSEKDIEVVVLTGKVSLTAQNDQQGIVVLPSEKAVYRKEMKQLAKVETQPEESVASVSGTEYDMNFNQTRMLDAIRRIEQKFNVAISLTDPSMNNCTITANLTDQSLKKTLDVITLTLHARYEVNGGVVTLTGTGCSE